MTRTPKTKLHVALSAILTACVFCNSDEAKAEAVDLPGGFQLGSSLGQAKQHAGSQDWQLVQLSPELPGQWIVKGTEIGLFVCDDRVASIHQRATGTLDDFARMVLDLEVLRGKPDVQVAVFTVGPIRISTIDARFRELDGQAISVQLSSTAGKTAISTNYRSGGCQNQ